MFKDPIICQEAIGHEAAACLTGIGWQSIRIECLLDGRSTDLLFEYVDEAGKTAYATKVGRLPELFIALADLMRRDGQKAWTRCDFTLDAAGHYHASFAY